MRETLNDYCERTGRVELLRQWHPELNGELTPGSLSYGSKRKVWWRCEQGHEWQAAVHTRTGRSCGCPVCAGKVVLPGVNDLASQYPDLAAQWHPTRNGTRGPEAVLTGTHQKVWWRCGKGHEWQAMVKSRVNGCGCPVCAGRTVVPGDNDLATTHPAVAAQWNQEKNGSLTPQQVVAGTRRKVWWRCDKGHEWQAAVAARASGTGCPVCAGKKIIPGENDLTGSFPDIAAQWHPAKNGALRPDSVSPYSNRKVWWICDLGHEYAAAVAARTMNGSGCPYCVGRKVLVGFNDLATLEPKVAAQWHPTLNGALTAEMVTTGSHQKVWWQCPEGHVWKAVVYARAGAKKSGCPVCTGKFREPRQDCYRNMRTAGKIIAAQAVLK